MGNCDGSCWWWRYRCTYIVIRLYDPSLLISPPIEIAQHVGLDRRHFMAIRRLRALNVMGDTFNLQKWYNTVSNAQPLPSRPWPTEIDAAAGQFMRHRQDCRSQEAATSARPGMPVPDTFCWTQIAGQLKCHAAAVCAAPGIAGLAAMFHFAYRSWKLRHRHRGSGCPCRSCAVHRIQPGKARSCARHPLVVTRPPKNGKYVGFFHITRLSCCLLC